MLRRDFIRYSLFFAVSIFANKSQFTTIDKLKEADKTKDIEDIFKELKFYPANIETYIEKDYLTFEEREYFICEIAKKKNLLLAYIDKKSLEIKKLLPSPNDISKSTNPNDYLIKKEQLKYPIKRAKNSKRGDGKWEKISWSEAINEISNKIDKNSIIYSNKNPFIDRIKKHLSIPFFEELIPTEDIDNSDLIISIFSDRIDILPKLKDKKLVVIDLMATNLTSKTSLLLPILDFNLNSIIRAILFKLLTEEDLTPKFVTNSKESLISRFKDSTYEHIKDLIDFKLFDEFYRTILDSKKICILSDEFSDELILLLDLKESLEFEEKSLDDVDFHHRLSDVTKIFKEKKSDKISLFSPRGENIIFDSYDNFRLIEVLKDERRVELSFDLNSEINETNTFCDYILPIDESGTYNEFIDDSKKIKLYSKTIAEQLTARLGSKNLNSLEANKKIFNRELMSENDFWIEIFKIKALSFEKLTEKSIQIEPFIPRKESVRLTFKNSKKFRLDSEFSFCLYSFDFPFKRNSGYLKEITREHNPILISTNELKRLNLKDGHLVRVKFLDDITGLEVGHLVAQLMGTESIADKVLAIDRGLGGFSLSRQIDILNQKDTIYLDKAEATFSIDGDKIEFRYNSKDGGLWQNPLYPTSSKFHKVVIEEAIKGDRIGDLLINHQNSLKVAKAHKDF